MMPGRMFLVFLFLALSCFLLPGFAKGKLVQEEVDALQEIAKTMGSTSWKFNAESCTIEVVGLTTEQPEDSKKEVECRPLNGSNTDSHVVSITLKRYSLPGELPPQLVKLPYLQKIDFAYNHLSGSIPRQWASTQLTSISVMANHLSGEIPKELANVTSLSYLTLETNLFSGIIPSELSQLVNLETLILSSNQFSGNLPESLGSLTNLTDFRINDNNFSGTIPGFIQNWRNLTRLEMHASGLEGPIPSNISHLNKLTELRISDMGGPNQEFPLLSNVTSLVRLVLRSCNLVGELPDYLWTLGNLDMLDVSFNRLTGKIPSTITAAPLRFIYLTGNSLSGDIPESILRDSTNVDLAYNNFTQQDPKQPACRKDLNMNLNLYHSASVLNSSRLTDLPCQKTFRCPRYSSCLLVNSGGNDISVKENKTTLLYKGDGDVKGGAATSFVDIEKFWGLSSTGDFMDDNDYQNTRYTESLQSSNMSELYLTVRVSPISLTYFHYCLKNGSYTVILHFAETQFTNDESYKSLGRRFFDIYVQERLVHKNFNIQDEVHSAQIPFELPIPDVNVTENILEVRFYFAGRGTTRIPKSGVYGPIISGLSVFSGLKENCEVKPSNKAPLIVGIAISATCLIFFVMGLVCWKYYFQDRYKRKRDLQGLELQTSTFTLRQLEAATRNFDPRNKLGEGGFGAVYKGELLDGTFIAVKQLSSKSRQGNHEFVNEIGLISCLHHPNLVKLYGCCIEGNNLLLVYEYMENNSLAHVLFAKNLEEPSGLKLDWQTRLRICDGIARGLTFLHEESTLRIVHRDIKATNVLLDKDLNAKISDFGLAKLNEEDNTHISTRVAGTIGYMAPEYALWGHLTYKTDIYAFGVVALEIVSGKNNSTYRPLDGCVCLLDWAFVSQKNGNIMDIVDPRLGSEFNKEEATRIIKIALLCTNASPSLRPTMSEVVSMLEGQHDVKESESDISIYGDALQFQAFNRNFLQTQDFMSGSSHTPSTSSMFGQDLYPIRPDTRKLDISDSTFLLS